MTDVAAFFQERYRRPPEVVASAPGRIEFIGNHTDYNGGLVLGLAINQRIYAALAVRTDAQIGLCTAPASPLLTFPLDGFARQTGPSKWANYVLGVLQRLRAHGLAVERGFDLAIRSTLPSGAGLSSSAALELATALALDAAFGPRFDRLALVQRCQEAENQFVGVPCGLLDQGVSAFGQAGHLVCVDARNLRFETVPLPSGTAFHVFSSHHRHALIDSCYAERHAECMAARDRLATCFPGLEHLCDLSPDQLAACRSHLPNLLYRRAWHVVTEQARVQATLAALQSHNPVAVGQHLLASHTSSRDFFENSTVHLDFLVDALRQQPGVLGARLTGGGFGGAVMAWTTPAFTSEHAGAVQQAYRARFGQTPALLTVASGDGARVERME
jgi:galactokinase